MIEEIILSSYALCIGVGLFVMAFGDWKKLPTKLLGVSGATISSIILVAVFFSHLDSSLISISALVGILGRNVFMAIVFFAVGRDAIILKKGDRRLQ